MAGRIDRSRGRLLPLVLLTLTAVTGIVDAESYLSLGHVFTANMTGNVVFIAFAWAGAQGLSVARSGTALVGFLAGATVTRRLARGLERNVGRRVSAVLFVQAALLLVASAVAIDAEGRLPDARTHLYAVIALTAIAMGLQNALSLRLGVPGFTPNVLTTALTEVAGGPLLPTGRDSVPARRVASVAMMFAGALFGAWFARFSTVWRWPSARRCQRPYAWAMSGVEGLTRTGSLPSCPCLRGSTDGSETPTCRE